MIIVIIFYLHILFAVLAFTQRWQEEGLQGGFIILGFLGLVFTVSWAVAGFIIHFLAPSGISGLMNADTLSLVILSVIEGTIYYFYFFKDEKKQSS
jgi:predicted cation transporter